MNRKPVKLLLSALCLTAACDPLSQVPKQMRGSEELAPIESAAKDGECATCMKWSARPPSGVNGPPWSNQ